METLRGQSRISLLRAAPDHAAILDYDQHERYSKVAEAIDRFEKAVEWPVEAVERKWAGLRTFTPDRRMKFGFDPDHPSFFWCVGQGGMGIQTAPAASMLCASLIRGDSLPPDLAGIRPDDFAITR